MNHKDDQSEQAAKLRRQAEEIARGKEARSPEDLVACSPVEIRQTLHELRVHQIELEMQNEELRRTQVELDGARVRYFDLFDLAPVGYVTLSEKGLILDANLTAATLLGVARGELVEQPVTRFIHREDQDVYYHHRKQLFETGEPQSCDLRMIKKDGTTFWAHLEATAAQDTHGASLCRVMMSDITERKRAEDALRESEENYRNLFENASEAIFVAQDGNLVFLNPMAIRLIGYAGEEIMSRPFVEFIHPDDRQMVVNKHIQRLKGKLPAERYSFRIVDGGGKIRWVELNAVFINWKGKPASLNFMPDITERNRAEEEKAKLEAQLQQAQKMESVGRLAGGVAHDFNNMLAVILGHAEIAMAQVNSAQPIYDDLMEIHKAAERSADLTRQLLAFARRQTIAPKVLDLNETVAGMLKMLERLIGEDIHLDWQPGLDLWPVRLDPSQIDQILANLCVNARDAIANVGRITIETRNWIFTEDHCAAHPGFVPGEYVRLAVSDDGCGIDKDTLANVFDPFFTTKEMGKGTGLGLATVYGAVKQNNGFIDVCSEPGEGTTFAIYLPRHVGEAGQARTGSKAGVAVRGLETILLVEDYPAMLKPATKMLEMQGYTVLAASTPGEAISLARKYAGEIHLLMTDVVMPEMNGQDLARNLQALYPHLKRLFMSGYPASVVAPHGVLDEGVYFIQKPFTMQSLAAKVREALDSQ
jgi:PAS domain S-box-containing protein